MKIEKFKERFLKTFKNKQTSAVWASLISILFGLVSGFIVLLIFNPANSGAGFLAILKGGFSGGAKGVGEVLYFATPLIMTGLAVGLSFKTGQFNIGASGQFIVGAFASIYVGVKWTWLPGALHWVVAVLVATLAGAIWGLIPGLLKAFLKVNEVISTIMMNFIGMYTVNYLVKATVYDTAYNQSMDVAKNAELPKWFLDNIFKNQVGNYTDISTVNIGIFIAIIIAIFMYIILEKTNFGFEIKAVGHNQSASKYSGIDVKKNIILSLAISGALTGLGGSLLYLSGPSGKHLKVVEEIAQEGFLGIPVALLSLSSPIGSIIIGIFMSHLTVGGSYLQTLGYMPEIINIIIGVIIFFSSFAVFTQMIMGDIKQKWRSYRGKKSSHMANTNISEKSTDEELTISEENEHEEKAEFIDREMDNNTESIAINREIVSKNEKLECEEK